MDVLKAQPISRVAAKRIERALAKLPSALEMPVEVNGSQAPSTPPRVPLLDEEETPPSPPHAIKPSSQLCQTATRP
eukprot:6556034-Prymnesium_polylepis.1